MDIDDDIRLLVNSARMAEPLSGVNRVSSCRSFSIGMREMLVALNTSQCGVDSDVEQQALEGHLSGVRITSTVMPGY